jgi:hypothetical protein
VGVLHTVEDNEQIGGGDDFLQFGVGLGRAQRDHSLMGFDAGDAIQSAALFKAQRSAGGPRQIDDFLEAMSAGATRDENAIEGAFGAQRFDHGMNSDENGQVPIIPQERP